MTTNAPRERYDLVAVKSVANVVGKYGDQWELQAQWSFSQYPSKAWVSDASSENDDNRIYHPKSTTAPQPDREYPCIIRRGVKSKKRDEDETGESYDGTMAWMYRWKMIEFDTDKDASDYPGSDSDREVPGEGAGPVQAPRQQGDQGIVPMVIDKPPMVALAVPPPYSVVEHDERQRLIVQQNILNRAVDLYRTGTLADRASALQWPQEKGRKIDFEYIKAIADDLWKMLPTIGQDPVPDAPESPESDATLPAVAEREYERADAPPDPGEEMPWGGPDPTDIEDTIAPEKFNSLKAFGKWCKDVHNLSSSDVLAIAQSIGIEISTTIELADYINDQRLIEAIVDYVKA